MKFKIKLGNKNHLKKLEQGGFKVSSRAKELLEKMPQSKGTFDLEIVSVKDLGFDAPTTYAEICEKAKTLGLGLCPAEVGPQLRLQYTDQPKGEWVVVAMEPITDSNGDLFVFGVERDYDGLWLFSSYGGPGDVWRADRRFVFVRRKSALSTSVTQNSLDTLTLDSALKMVKEAGYQVAKII